VEPALNQKRRRSSKYGPFDEFLLLLNFFKFYPLFDQFAQYCGYNQATSVEVLLRRVIETVWEFVKPVSKRYQDEKKKISFEQYPEVALIIDVTFQPCYRPTGRFYEARYYWSHKHYQYGIKTEVGTSPNGCAMFVSKHYPGSVHDFTLFSKNLQNYQSFLQKKTTDNSINDIGELRNKYPHSWALMADRGYEGAARFIRAILPKKGTRLSLEDTTRNRKFNEHRVIIENFFGRMKLLWKIVSVRYRWDHSIYDKIMKFPY